MRVSLGAAYKIDFSRPIGRLDWFRGFSDRKARIEAVVSPALICLPSSNDWSRRVGLTFQAQTTGHRFPLRNLERSQVGALYYLDNFEPVGAVPSDAIPEGARTLRHHEPVGRRTHFERFIVRLSAGTTDLFVDELPLRIRAALELHAPVPPGLAIYSIRYSNNVTIAVPSSAIVFTFYYPILRRDISTLLGLETYPHTIGFDGFRYAKRENIRKVYPFRRERGCLQAHIEAGSLLTRAFLFRTDDGALPFIVRPATNGRVQISGRMYKYVDDAGTIFVAPDAAIGLPLKSSWDPTRSLTAYAPNFFMGSVWLSSAGKHAPWKRGRKVRLHDVHTYRRHQERSDHFDYWYSMYRVGLEEFEKSIGLRPQTDD